LEYEIAKYNKSRGVERTSIHVFRRNFAKQWVLNGGDIFRLQKILGHRSLDMVRRYADMYGNDLHRDFDNFNALDNYLGNTAKEGKIAMRPRR
jgi:integrase/recombinase XerD